MNCKKRNDCHTIKRENLEEEEIKLRNDILRLLWPRGQLFHSLDLQRNDLHALNLLDLLRWKSNSLSISVPSPNINVGESSSILSYLESAHLRIRAQESSYLSQLRIPWQHSFVPLVPTSEAFLPSINPEYLAINISNEKDNGVRNTKGNRDPKYKFPCRLHQIISNPQYSEYITWLPHGRAWKILERKQFETIILPRYFRHGRFSSFLRQVNGWGFRRVTEGPDHNSYFHEHFVKDKPQLCWTMQRSPDLTKSNVSPQVSFPGSLHCPLSHGTDTTISDNIEYE